MHDILPEDQKYFQYIYNVVADIADFYGFEKIETPIVEETELFIRGVGVSTDIVEKEMYSFRTKGGDNLSLRPEMTSPIARAFIQHGMHSWPQPVKLWYFGPCFRYERPQAGRYRQFWQFGFEILGEESPAIDALIIQIFYNILQQLKIKDLIIQINSIGDSQCRPYYKKLLSNYFRSRQNSLCFNCKRRLRENVLRILDCKEEKCQPIKAQAPQILDHLCDGCKTHFKEVLEYLDELEISYNLNPYLVRGLDYYTRTVFEIFSQKDLQENTPRQSAFGGGGRYDKLIKLLRGKDTPACGGAVGVERIVEYLKQTGIKLKEQLPPKIFLAQIGFLAKRKSLMLLEKFRKAKIKVAESLGRDSLRAQLAKANAIKAKYTLIIGHQEALENKIIIRDMETGGQEIVKLDRVVEKIRKKLKKK